MVVVMVVAMLALGPRRLPEIARQAGRAMREFRRAAAELRSTIDKAIEETPVTDVTDDPTPAEKSAVASSLAKAPSNAASAPESQPESGLVPANVQQPIRAFTLTPAQDAEPIPSTDGMDSARHHPPDDDVSGHPSTTPSRPA